MNKFASWRLGKSSVQDIHSLNKLPAGIQKNMPRFTVKCTQVPQDFIIGTYVFIWLGSDNNKGIPTEWKQGFKAIGRLVHINRGERFSDESTSIIEIIYVFSEVFNRIDVLRESPIPYYWCSAFPIIGIDDHSNQTIRMFSEGEERSDINAFFEILKENVPEFAEDAVKIDPNWTMLLDFVPNNPKDVNSNKVTHQENSSYEFLSSDISEFWNHVGAEVLTHDESFSLLPTYYHKGHIRVKCNYGGACNFSIGFYDKESGRVNPNVSFEYNGIIPPNIEENLFYLNTDVKDRIAFDRFIPIFNNAYRGMFEIQKSNDEFIFINHLDQRKPLYTSNKRRQVIYFGAPGTGKSHAVDKILKSEAPKRNVRTTFHPDSDYSSFVGCYKPSMRGGNIEYSFIAQAFINAYVGAWSDLSQPFYLVIEEINRGNCAQIFGDIFQLLDRDSLGESNYSIRPDSDLQKYLAEKLGLFPNIPDEIRNGYEMRLPRNLFIYATMNTSDQSLFPIDSAFKRRWDWRYTAIKPAENDHAINVNGIRYNWTSFIREVNKKILDLTKSEDKQLGYWFIKPDDNGDIDWELFVSKALFYIWNDVIKDYATLEKADSPFGRNYAFTTFFDENGEPLADRVIAFLDALKVDKFINKSYADSEETTDEVNEESEDEDDDSTSSGKDRTKYSINGEGRYGKNILATELVQKYVEIHPDATAFEVVKAFRSLGNLVSHFVELQEEFNLREDQNPRVKTVSCKNENIYVSTNGWGGKDKMRELIDGVHSKDWGLTITEIPR